MKITLPSKKGNPNETPSIELEQLVVIGANGSGKTRFGSQIEKKYPHIVHRISAQKSLNFPSEVSPKSKDRAEREFLYGSYNPNYTKQQQAASNKQANRWGNKLNTYLLNDFGQLTRGQLWTFQ